MTPRDQFSEVSHFARTSIGTPFENVGKFASRPWCYSTFYALNVISVPCSVHVELAILVLFVWVVVVAENERTEDRTNERTKERAREGENEQGGEDESIEHEQVQQQPLYERAQALQSGIPRRRPSQSALPTCK